MFTNIKPREYYSISLCIVLHARYKICSLRYVGNHWAATACAEGQVIVANSVGDTMGVALAIQLRQLYANSLHDDGKLEVKAHSLFTANEW